MKKKLMIVVFCMILLIIYLLVGNYFHIYLFCPIRKLTGLYCPGCGVTRMCLHLLKGNFYQAFRYNPLLFICLPIFAIYYFDLFIRELQQKKPRLQKLEPKLWYVLIGIFLIYGVLRNLPYFDFLKPTLIK